MFRNYKYELLTEHDLGVTIDLINPDVYTNMEVITLTPDCLTLELLIILFLVRA